MEEWCHQEAFWEAVYPFMFFQKEGEVAHQEAQKLDALIRLKDSPLLDLACGPGRHAGALAALGYSVTGVDLNPYLLNKAKEQATVEWILEDMREFVRPAFYGTVINMYSSFGYFPSPEDDLKVAMQSYQNLRPGGQFILQISGKATLGRHLTPVEVFHAEGKKCFLERTILPGWEAIRLDWTLIDGNTCQTYEVECRLYSATEIKTLLLQAGFDKVSVFGNLDQRPYDFDAEQLIVIAEKGYDT